MQASATRFNGTLKKWNAERGFGFVVSEQGGQELFLHVSAMPRDGLRSSWTRRGASER
jgi:cold shock CspA family protein